MSNTCTFSSYTNAYALYLGTKQLGIALTTTDSKPTFPIPVAAYPCTPDDWLMFTEESSLQRALNGEIAGKFWPKQFPMQLLDDKWALVEWLQSYPNLVQGLRQWRLADLDQISYPCLLKAKHSWQGGVKLPRGWICRSKQEAARQLHEITHYPDWENVFFFQEWLGDGQCRVISVCGFHDTTNHERNLSAVVERISAHNEGLSCSAAVQTIPDAWLLREKTAAILDTLEFTGPFELEYLVVGEHTLVLELNPRFWMQHAIFLANQNGLIKRYLNLETSEDRCQKVVENVVWIDSLHLVLSLCQLRFAFLSLVVKKMLDNNLNTVIWPSISMAIRICACLILQKLKIKFSKPSTV